MYLSATAGNTYAFAKLGEDTERLFPDVHIMAIFLAKDYSGYVPVLMEYHALQKPSSNVRQKSYRVNT